MSIMVILRNIVKNEDVIQCDYLHEDEAEVFKMVINFVTGETIMATDPSHGGYTYHAKEKLLRLAKLDNPPAQAREMWY